MGNNNARYAGLHNRYAQRYARAYAWAKRHNAHALATHCRTQYAHHNACALAYGKLCKQRATRAHLLLS